MKYFNPMAYVLTILVCYITAGPSQKGKGTTGSQFILAENHAQVLSQFKGTLSAKQQKLLDQMSDKSDQSPICPDCENVDHGGVIVHGIRGDHGPGSRDIIMPEKEENRLATINATLWDTLNLIKGKDTKYMADYRAEEKATAPTTIEQIALRSKYIRDLVGQL